MAKRKHEVNYQGYKTLWEMGPKGSNEVHVDVYKKTATEGDKLVLEWAFPKIRGNNILGNAAIYLDQVLMYAKDPSMNTESEPALNGKSRET